MVTAWKYVHCHLSLNIWSGGSPLQGERLSLLIPSICIFQKSLEQVFKACLEDGFEDLDHDFAHDGRSHPKLISH